MTVAVWVVVAGFAAWATVRVFGLDRGYPLVQLIAFTPYVVYAALVVLPILALLRRWTATGVLAMTAAVLVACVLPRWIPDRAKRRVRE